MAKWIKEVRGIATYYRLEFEGYRKLEIFLAPPEDLEDKSMYRITYDSNKMVSGSWLQTDNLEMAQKWAIAELKKEIRFGKEKLDKLLELLEE